MGKQGPCCHCGVTSTPLWRNGPPEKPVLCNACGSRWRTKGSLAHYTPLRVRAEKNDIDKTRFSRMKNNTSIKNKDVKVLKRKKNYDSADISGPSSCYSEGSDIILDEDTSNWSSSGSVVSNSESFAQVTSADTTEFTGPPESVVWDSTVPSRKKTCTLSRLSLSPVEKLTKDLYAILQEQQSSCLSGSFEDDLLFESDRPMVSVEIGHGSMLIRHPDSLAHEEESDASSLSVYNKQLSPNETYSRLPTLPEHTGNKKINLLNKGSVKVEKPRGPELNQGRFIRDKDHLEKLHMLGHHNSPLWSTDLNDIICYDEFIERLTIDEQQQLLKCLPSVDSASPSSLRKMFENRLFKENISGFQKLLAEGVFDNTMSKVKIEDCRALKKLVLCNVTNLKWVEKYTSLKNVKDKSRSPSEITDISAIGSRQAVNIKKSCDVRQLNVSGGKAIMKSAGTMEPIEYDQELLVTIPSNSFFPQAELLMSSSSVTAQASTGSCSVYKQLLQQ